MEPLEIILSIGITALVGLASWGLITLVSINNKLAGLHEWRLGHEVLDKERDARLADKLTDIEKLHLERAQTINDRLAAIDHKLDKEIDKLTTLLSARAFPAH